MKASFVDLRKKSGEIIRALRRKERVTVFYRGEPAAVMHPVDEADEPERKRTSEHAAFGLWADRDDLPDVAAHVRRLRGGRFDDL